MPSAQERDHRGLLSTFDMWDAEHVRWKDDAFAYARRECPIVHTSAGTGFWLITRYEDARRILEDWETFSSVEGSPTPTPVRLGPVDSDPPHQTALRALINPVLSRAFSLRFEPEMRRVARRGRGRLAGGVRAARRAFGGVPGQGPGEPARPAYARNITRDVEVGGIAMKAGERVLIRYDSANRDETRFPDPDRLVFDPPRPSSAAFGLGVHRCLGMHLARVQLAVAFEELLAHITRPRLACAPDVIVWTPGITIAPGRIPLRFDRRSDQPGGTR